MWGNIYCRSLLMINTMQRMVMKYNLHILPQIIDIFRVIVYYYNIPIKIGGRNMYKKSLAKFLTENNPESQLPSAAGFAHFKIMVAKNPEANEYTQDLTSKFVLEDNSQRKINVEVECEKISSLNDAHEIVNLMRKHIDALNHNALIEKALELEDEVVPLLLKRLKTSFQDEYIEIACLFLAVCKNIVADVLISYYDELHNPYTKSSLLVALGFLAQESDIPWVHEQYFDLKKAYPNDSYHEGAYYALWEMEGRFYPVQRGK